MNLGTRVRVICVGIFFWFSLCVDSTLIDIPLQSTYVTKYIEKCPEEGYFFKRDLPGTADVCYLCFCKGNGTDAVCWPRNNKRCDAESYQHNWTEKRSSRNRRSFSNLFFGDAARSVLNQNARSTCKPNEASYSEGCPPVDWCVGCTVCDCNINGKWDCHLLSFCSEDDKKKRKKGEKGELKGHFYDPFDVPKTRRADRIAARQQVQSLAEKMAQERQKKKIGKSNTRRYVFKNGTLVNKTIFDMRKRKKSRSILNETSEEIEKWSKLNMKIRKIPDEITRQRMIDKQQKNAKKVSESANFFVRKMPNKKTKELIDQKHAIAVNVLAKRQPNKKKKRQVILPSGFKIPKELLDKIPAGMFPTRDPPGDHFPKKSHVKRVLPNQMAMAATKPNRQVVLDKKQVKRSIPSSQKVPDKKLVKRSTKYETPKNGKQQQKKTIMKQKSQEKQVRGNKKVPVARSKPKSKLTTMIKNAKIKKRNLQNNVPMNKKNNPQKRNNWKSYKNKTNTKDNSKKSVFNRNDHSKNRNSVKNSPNNKDLRKNIKTSNNKKSNIQISKMTKNKNINNENSKKHIKGNIIINNKNKKVNNNNDKNKKSKDKNDINDKLINKPTTQKTRLNNPKAGNTREKRSDVGPWVKTVTEGNKVTKYVPKIVSSSTKSEKTTKKPARKAAPKASPQQVSRRRLDEQVKKLTGNIQANLNRRVVAVVEQMLGHKLSTPKTNKQRKRRAALLEPEMIPENLSDEIVNDSGVKFSTTKSPETYNQVDRKQIRATSVQKNIEDENQGLSLPFIDFYGQRVKRSKIEDQAYNESRHIPFIVKKRPLPPVKHIEKRQVKLSPFEDPAIKLAAFKSDEFEKSSRVTTEDYLTTDMKTFVPLSNSEQNSDSSLVDIHIPIKKTVRNNVNPETTTKASLLTNNEKSKSVSVGMIEILDEVEKIDTTPVRNKKVKRSTPLMKKITMQKTKQNERRIRSHVMPIKKSQKVPVDKTNKIKVKRHKRSTDIKVSETTNSQNLVNEISTNSLQDISNITIENKLGTTDPTFKYYKYTIDDYLDSNTKPTDTKYLSEVVEVYTKSNNNAAKRSVDRLPNYDVLQITSSDSNTENVPVWSLNKNNEDTNQQNNTLFNKDNTLKVHSAVSSTFNPADVLDDRVVIIQDNNVSYISNLSDHTKDYFPYPTVANDSEINKTVIGIKNNDNQSIENFIKPSADVNKSTTMIDESVVIIKDETNLVMPATTSYLGLTAKYKSKLKLNNTTDTTFIENENLLVITTDRNERYGINEANLAYINNPSPTTQPTENTSFSVTDNIRYFNGTEKSAEDNIKYTKDVNIDDTIVFIRENEMQQKTTSDSNKLLNSNKKYLLKLTTENYLKSHYKVDDNYTTLQTTALDNELKVSALPTTDKTTTEEVKNKENILKSIIKNYLNYDLDSQSRTLEPNITNHWKYKKLKQLLIKKDKIVTSTEKITTKQNIDDYVVVVVPKDFLTKNENSTEANNDVITATDQEITRKLDLITGTSDKSEDSWVPNTTLNIIEGNYYTTSQSVDTTTYLNNLHSTEVLPLKQHVVKGQANESQMYSISQNIVKTHDIKKIDLKKARKHKLKKILSTLHNKTRKDERYFNKDEKYFIREEKSFIESKVNTQKNANKTKDLKSFFKKLLSGFKFNKHMRKPSNVKRFKILKYLQKFFKKIFSDNGNRKKNKTIDQTLNRRSILETLCSSFGPCNINVKNKAKLQSQIDHLNSETYKMLRSVKIIKGLLKLVDMAQNDKKLSNGTTVKKTSFKNDVQKLHAILRDTYSQTGQIDKLSETQKIQIQYIKNSTQNFIQSAAKFTMVLNEIINIITSPDHKTIKEDHFKTSSERNDKLDVKKILKSHNVNKTSISTGANEALKKLKELISKYSLIQNTFMRKIYNVLTNLDNKGSIRNNDRMITSTSTKKPNSQNKTEEIQIYTKNIIQNLRKLKNLAQTLNSDVEHVRRKRDLRNDDSLEYMLMLMEYLLKQQHPLDAAPVNDGIDLLLEAIKSAPDIKAIKKKVLPKYNHPTPVIIKERNVTKPSSESSEIKRSKETSSDSDSKPSKEENVTTTNTDETKYNVIDQSMDDEGDEQDYYMFNRRGQSYSSVDKTTSTQGHTIAGWHDLGPTDPYYNTIPDVETTSRPEIKNKNRAYDTVTKFDIFNNVEEEATTLTTTEFEYSTTATGELTFITEMPEMSTKSSINTPTVHTNRYNKGEDDVSASKSRIDWLDETYEEEIKTDTQKTTLSTAKTPTHVRMNKAPKEIESVNVTKDSKKNLDFSGLSKETNIEDEISKKPTYS